MFRRLVRFFVMLLFSSLLERSERRVVRQLKIKGAKTYLHLVQGVRVTAIGAVVLLLMMQVLSVGFFFMCGALLWLTPWELETKIWSAFGLGVFLFLVPLGVILALFSSKLWYEASGARGFVEGALRE